MHRRRDSATDFLFTLTLFCVFAVSALMVVLIGVRVYRSTVENMTENYSTRTAVAYLQEKLRENDTQTAPTVERREGVSMLVLRRAVGGETYETCVYWLDGSLRELFVKSGAQIDPSAGQRIADIDGLSFEQADGGLLRVRVESARGGETLLFYEKSA